jgi:ribonuclease HI
VRRSESSVGARPDSISLDEGVRDWIPKWIRNNWRTANGEPVKNRPLIQYLSDLIQTRPGRVQLQHVRGHAGEAGNEGADKLAGLGAALEWREENKDEWTFHGWKGEAQANVGSSGPSSITVPSDFEVR